MDPVDIDPNNRAPLDLAPATHTAALNTIQRLYALLEKKNAALEVARDEVALAQAQVRLADADKELCWMQLHDTLAMLGCIVPESVPHSVAWAKKIRAYYEADTALISRAYLTLEREVANWQSGDPDTIRVLADLRKRVQG